MLPNRQGDGHAHRPAAGADMPDGVTAAQGDGGSDFRGGRLDAVIAGTGQAEGVDGKLHAVSQPLDRFVGDHRQSDDLMMLAMQGWGPAS